jgi:plastocyanin
MVQILPLVGAAALLAQVALGAVVPVRRTNHEQQNNNYDNNNYNVGSYQNQYNNYQQQQESNNRYYQGNQDSNQDGRGHETTTAERQQAHETTTAMEHETTTVEEQRQQEETTTMVHETTTVEEQQMEHETTTVEEQQAHETTTMEHETTTVQEQQAHETSTYEYPQYGSGSNQYNNNGYNDCVSQCMAQFGAPPSTMTMERQQNAQETETASGAIHTVMVAPTGVGLRYVPFAVNASVGDTIRYVWTTPNNHTVTLSSALTVCNKSAQAESREFVSGVRNAATEQQIFDVKVETDQPQFYYCSVQQHCQKGMFGIINPGNDVGAANSVGSLMTSMMTSNPQLQAAYQYIKANVSDTAALNWGMGMSTEGIPEDQWENVATNVLVTQAMFGANPGMLEYGHGAATPDGSPITMLGDLNVLLSANYGTPPTNLVVSSSTGAAATSTPSLTPVNATSGALSGKSAASVWVAAFVGVVGFLLF